MRRLLVAALALLVILVGLLIAKLEHDRHQCPPGPWAHPLDRLKGGAHSYNDVCAP